MPLPPQRSRKLPSRRHQPQLRLSIHQVADKPDKMILKVMVIQNHTASALTPSITWQVVLKDVLNNNCPGAEIHANTAPAS